MDGTLLTVRDVAQMLKLTPNCIRKYVARGKIPSIKLCGARRFEPEAIRKFIEARKEGPQR